jgi:hypothetical protein
VGSGKKDFNVWLENREWGVGRKILMFGLKIGNGE